MWRLRKIENIREIGRERVRETERRDKERSKYGQSRGEIIKIVHKSELKLLLLL